MARIFRIVTTWRKALLLAALCGLTTGCDNRSTLPAGPAPTADAPPPTMASAAADGAAPVVADGDAGPRFARLALDCIEQQYPFISHVPLRSAADLTEPMVRHPLFHGCGSPANAAAAHALLVRLVLAQQAGPFAAEAEAALARRMTKAAIAVETQRLADAPDPVFAAALLAVAAALNQSADDGNRLGWRADLDPLITAAENVIDDHFDRLSFADRSDGPTNTAHLMLQRLANHGPRSSGKAARAEAAARRLFAFDQPCPADAAPGIAATVSPCLAEAMLYARLTGFDQRQQRWFERRLADVDLAPLVARPRTVGAPDPLRFDVLNLYRARAFAILAEQVPNGKSRSALVNAAAAHRRAALPAVRDDMPPALALAAAEALLPANIVRPADPVPLLAPVDRATSGAE